MKAKKRLCLSEQLLFLAAGTPIEGSSIYIAILFTFDIASSGHRSVYFLNAKSSPNRRYGLTRSRNRSYNSHARLSFDLPRKGHKRSIFCRSSWRVREKRVIHRLRSNQRQGLQHYAPFGASAVEMMPLYRGPKRKGLGGSAAISS